MGLFTSAGDGHFMKMTFLFLCTQIITTLLENAITRCKTSRHLCWILTFIGMVLQTLRPTGFPPKQPWGSINNACNSTSNWPLWDWGENNVCKRVGSKNGRYFAEDLFKCSFILKKSFVFWWNGVYNVCHLHTKLTPLGLGWETV